MVYISNDNIPKGWARTTLGEIHLDLSQSINPRTMPDQLFELYSVPSFATGKPEITQGNNIGSSKRIIQNEAVLLCKINPRINRIWVVENHTGYPQIASTEWIPFFNLQGLEPRYLCYFLTQHRLRDFLASNVSGVGGSLMRIKPTTFANYPFPIAPLSEQHRIVAKIEELFTKLDAGKEELLQAKARLKRYRQSVLKAAMEGELTEDWRKKHGDEIEPASILLERILKERREKWEAEQLEQMSVKGNVPKDDKWKNKYKEPPEPNPSKLLQLPKGWVWATVGQVTFLVTKGSSPKWQGFSYVDKGILFLRSQNVIWGDINLSDIACLPKAFNEKQKKSILKKGDVLLNLVGASIGRAAIASDELEGANMNQAVALIRLVKDGLDNKLLMNYLLSPDVQSIIHGKKVDVARANLSLADVSLLPVTLPPLPEQHRIVSEVERRLSVADAVDATIDAELKRSDALRQSILKQAFSGKLVPQDPNDEPAEKLLARIKEDKVKRETAQKSKRKKTRTREQGITKTNDLLTGETRNTRIYDALKSVGQPLPPDELLELSKLDVDEFYAQLKTEIESGRIAERRPDKTAVFLEIKNEA